jgi:glycine/D-amino acid oxidase-like deaminating enzyme
MSAGGIVVCGAGVVGAAIARELACRGAAPTVVERARPGAAASGKAGGFLAADWNDGTPVAALARASFDLHRALARELGPEAIGHRPVETLHTARVEGGDVTGHRRLPNPAWLDGDVAVHAVIGTSDSTAQVDPARLTGALVDDAVARGAQLVRGVVEGVERAADGRARGVRVDGRTLEADVVVLALGPWTSRAATGLMLPPVHGLKGASITLAAEAPAQAVFCDYVHADGRRSAPEIYPRPGGRVYVNGFPMHEPLPDDPDAITPSEEACDELHRIAAAHSSALADAAIVDRRACYRPVTVDGVPLIGPVPQAPGVFVATGHGPWGILNAPATGRMVAEMILDGGSHSVDARPFDPARLLRTA